MTAPRTNEIFTIIVCSVILQVGSLGAVNNDIYKEVNSPEKYEEVTNGSEQSESTLFTSSVLLEQSKQVKTKATYQCDICSKTFTQMCIRDRFTILSFIIVFYTFI